MNKVIIVLLGNINFIPPIRSLLLSLSMVKWIETYLITTSDGINSNDILVETILVRQISEDYKKNISLIKKIIRTGRIRKKLWRAIDEVYDDNSLLWIVSDVCIKNLGRKLEKYNYVLHLFELINHVYLIPKYHFGTMKIEKYACKAKKVIVPEYNRAHITKAWWDLKELPYILPNKPYYKEIPTNRNLKITHSEEATKLLNNLKDKKIILYQGIIHKERPLENFIKAVDRLGEKYAFVLMSSDPNLYEEVDSSNYYFIPFVPAPFHLEITSHAYIGILSYVPVKTTYSILNAVYCAPNKTFEYARFGVPMISNDVPGLDYLFTKEKCGKITEIGNIDKICEAIQLIDDRYKEYSKGAQNYYNSVNYDELVKKLLEEVF